MRVGVAGDEDEERARTRGESQIEGEEFFEPILPSRLWRPTRCLIDHRSNEGAALHDPERAAEPQDLQGTLVGKLTPTAPNDSQWLPTTPDSSLRLQTHAVVV